MPHTHKVIATIIVWSNLSYQIIRFGNGKLNLNVSSLWFLGASQKLSREYYVIRTSVYYSLLNSCFHTLQFSCYQLKNLPSNYIRSELQMFNQHLGSKLELQIGVGNFNEQVLKSRLWQFVTSERWFISSRVHFNGLLK